MMKPDRIERAVKNLITYYDSSDGECIDPMLDKDEVKTLLRREAAYQRARMRRIVKAERVKYQKSLVTCNKYEIEVHPVTSAIRVCNDLLAALDRRAPGTRRAR